MRLPPIAPSDHSAEQRHLSVKVRLFIDFLIEHFGLDAA